MQTFLSAGAAYLLGSIPFGYLLYRLQRGDDIRSTGSGNIGATNVLRSAGLFAGVLTLILDASKGYLAVWLASHLTAGSPQAIAVASVLVIVGHSFPVFLRFRGGKGVATGLGAFAAISPSAILVCTAIFGLVLAGTRYVSLGSITAAGAFPFVLLATGQPQPAIVTAAFASAGLIILRHRANIQRLRSRTESLAFGPRKGAP